MRKMKDMLIESYEEPTPCESDYMTDEEMKKAMQQTQDDHLQAINDRVVQEGIDRRKGK